jgi:hydroxymethylpyrimidine/phosphomethylpyrimidine kinase
MQGSNNPSVVLTFTTSDPTGGSGLQGDILTVAALGGHPLSVMTGFTVQDTARIEGFSATEGDWVADQARALLEDIPVQAFKIGQISSAENAMEIADVLGDYPDIPVVFDVHLRGLFGTDVLADEETLGTLCELLVPLSSVLIINGSDAPRLVLNDEDGEEDLPEEVTQAEYARHLLEMGAKMVLLTGAHEQTPQIVNTLYGPGGVLRTDAWERLPGSWHGAGDTLSAALATLLAQGMEVSAAVHAAQAYTWQALAQGWRLGMGHNLPNRFCKRG